MTKYYVIDLRTQKPATDKIFDCKKKAWRMADRLDMQFGAVRYSVREVI